MEPSKHYMPRGIDRILYVMRHGPTEFNRLGILQGWTQDDPRATLTKPGQEVMDRFGKRFQAEGIIVQAAYRSDLSRVIASTDLVLPYISPPQEQVHVTNLQSLRERRFGEAEGKPLRALLELEYADAATLKTELYRALEEVYSQDRTTVFINPESVADVKKRLDEAIREVWASSHQSILIGGHEMANSYLADLLIGKSAYRRQENGHVHIFWFKGRTLQRYALNRSEDFKLEYEF